MSAPQDPTPCPRPRLPQPLTINRPRLATLTEEAATFVPQYAHGLLRDAKPRRPTRKARNSATWDPSVDIYDDTFAFKNPVAAVAAPTVAASEHVSNSYTHAQSVNRRSSLWAQPAQRMPLDADVKRRRVSRPHEMAQISTLQPEKPLHPRNSGSSASNKMPELRKDPRRRTIYVPSEDTTIMTIHPGASLRDPRRPLLRPNRNDLFLDLADPMPADDQLTSEVKLPKRAPRRSLAAAPRKAPLQPATRPVQANTPTRDIAGAGAGKENVPPGSLQGYGSPKPDEDYTCFLKASARRISTAPISQGLISPVAVSLKSPTVKNPLRSLNTNSPNRGATKRPSSSLSAKMSEERTTKLELQANNRISSPKPLQKEVSQRSPMSTSSEGALKLGGSLASQRGSRATPYYPPLTANVPSSELYEENWLSHQECVISELLNNLFQDADRREERTVCQGLDLQNRLVSMYHDQALLLLHKRLKASLQFGALRIAKGTLAHVSRFKHDLQQRQRFLDLWVKNYNLKSLQSAAEVVIGREIPLNLSPPASPLRSRMSDATVPRNKRLETFLKSFLIGNEDMSFQKSMNPGANFDESFDADHGSTAWLWRRTVVRSLMLVLLLDKAQTSGIFQERLFQSTAPFKSSAAVLQALGSLLLPSIGSIARILDHLSYHVDHVQHPLEDQSYRINNLAIDLRDGVLLTRLVEIFLYPPSGLELANETVTLLLPCGGELTSSLTGQGSERFRPLSQHLKFPCISRVQKLYNVQIALSALAGVEEFGIVLQDVKPEDIVDGHREKNVSLLWSIVGKWGLSALVDFELVKREIARLDKRWQDLRARRPDMSNTEEFDSREAIGYASGEADHKRMLKQWAVKAARLHEVTIINPSTSFFGGEAFQAIAAEYSACVREQLKSTKLPQSPESGTSLLSSTSIFDDSFARSAASRSSDSMLVDILSQLGCSRAFLSLFRNTNRMPSQQTTIPLLAFLASRFLPLSQPGFAAIAIQRAWRRNRMGYHLRRRVTLAMIARDCAKVVTTKKQIEEAAVVLQRWWRKVHA